MVKYYEGDLALSSHKYIKDRWCGKVCTKDA